MFAFAKLRVPLMVDGDHERAPVEIADAILEDRPLQVIRIRTEAPRVADRDFVAASAAAREARGRRDRDRDFASGRGGSGIFVPGGGGAGCDYPVTGAAVNRFGPNF